MNQPRIRTLIAEDEPLASESLAAWVTQFSAAGLPALELLTICADGDSALAQIRAMKPELVLMDIHMPGQTGLQVLRELARDRSAAPPAVIFTTAYDEHALTAFELHAVDYLLKPFSQERFKEAVTHALQTQLAQPDQQGQPGQPSQPLQALESLDEEAAPLQALSRILVRDQGKIFPLSTDDIEYLRSDTKYTAINSRGKQFMVRLPIAAFEQRLDPSRFLKLQRSCIINMDFVESMTPDDTSQLIVKMRDGTKFTASREVSKMLRGQAI